MSLRLVLGPANARKAGELLDAHEQAAQAGDLAWFVVPTSADAERFRRELAGMEVPGGSRRIPTPFGQVMTASALERVLLQRLAEGRRLLSREARRAVALGAIRTNLPRLQALLPAARSGWLADELIALREELTTTGDAGERAESGLFAWGRRRGDRRGEELALLLRADAAGLAQLASGPAGVVDRAEAAQLVIAALRTDPGALSELHLALSGFDDLDPVQRALVMAVARSGARVVLSLPFQAGREALTAAQSLIDYLEAASPSVAHLAPDTTVAGVAPVLARIERRLFEQEAFDAGAGASAAGAVSVTAAPQDAARPAVLELLGGGPDEELALIASYLATERAEGCAPARMAVVVADPAQQGPAIVAALKRAELPAHLVGRMRAQAFPSVRALQALLRAVEEQGTARDLVDWLAGPGGPSDGSVDELDAAIRRRGARTRKEAHQLWLRRGHPAVRELETLRIASWRSADVGALERAVAGALRTRLITALEPGMYRESGHERDLRAAGAVLKALDELALLAEQSAGSKVELRLGLPELRALIESISAPADAEPPDSIAVVGPLDVRTRHLEVVVLARAQRGSYPADEGQRRVLGPTDRGALTEHGWPRPVRPEHAAAERYLAYEVVARPTQRLALAWHDGDGDGKPCEPSPLIAHVRRAAGGELPRRALPVGSSARNGLPEHRAALIEAARAGERHREADHSVSALLAAQTRDHYSVGALQSASRCTAQWFVDHHLRPRPLSPDEAPLTAGKLRHEVLAEIVRAVVGGGQPLGPDALPALQSSLEAAALRRALAADKAEETLNERLMRERVVAEVEATLPSLCGTRELEQQPSEFELAFGTPSRSGDDEDDARPPVVVERAGEHLTLSGRIDRLDESPEGTELVIVDYKGASVEQYKATDWIERRELQSGLYALAAQELVGGEAKTIASLYQPVPGPTEKTPRGASSRSLSDRAVLKPNDKVGADGWDELLDALVGLAGDAQRMIDDGVVAPGPARCSDEGCRYPWLCREIQR